MLTMTQSRYKFVKFTGDYTQGDDRIGLSKSGTIRLTAGFFRKANLKNFKYAILFYDPENKAIAFKFTNQWEEGVFKLTKERSSAATISALSFMKANNLNVKTYFKKYQWKKNIIPEIGEVFIMKLDEK